MCERNQQKEGDAADDNVLVVLVGELGPASEKLSLFYFIFLTVFTHSLLNDQSDFLFFLAPHYLLTSVVLVLRKFVLKMIIL